MTRTSLNQASATPSVLAATEQRWDEISFQDALQPLVRRWRIMLAAPILAGVLGYSGSYLVRPVFSSTVMFLPPQQQQGGAAAALASLSSLAGLAGGAAARTPAEQYVGLMQSATVSNRLIDRFKLLEVYEKEFRQEARRELLSKVTFLIGKKDGLVSVTVEDHDASRAAAIANQYVDELRSLSAKLVISEAQQRRAFFEHHLQETKSRLIEAQSALESSGVSEGAIKAEPRAAAEGYAQLRAELTTAEVRLEAARGRLTDTAPEIQPLLATVQALRQRLTAVEKSSKQGADRPDYVSKYREFKYQEMLFELFARQFELARVDESKEGALIQVVDKAVPAEVKSKPRRRYYALAAAAIVFAGLVMYFIVQAQLARNRQTPA
jgi:capsule polysaccharide export protein KpsE/RkpR